jgi:hypothetical protein
MRLALFLAVFLFWVGRIWSADELAIPELVKAMDAYYKTMADASSEYRKILAQVLGKADKIEVYLIHLNSDPVPVPVASNLEDDDFLHYGPAKILKRKVLTEEERKRLTPLLQATVAAENPGGGASCHDPAHAIRVWHGKNLIFESTICFHCGNLSVEVAYSPTMVGLTQPDFNEEMLKLMPIPEKSAKNEDNKVKKKEPKKKG